MYGVYQVQPPSTDNCIIICTIQCHNMAINPNIYRYLCYEYVLYKVIIYQEIYIFLQIVLSLICTIQSKNISSNLYFSECFRPLGVNS